MTNQTVPGIITLEEATQPLQPPIPLATRYGWGMLVALTRPWRGASLLTFLRQWADVPRVYWEGGSARREPPYRAAEGGTVGFGGCGVAAVLTADGANRFQTIRQHAAQLFGHAILEPGGAPPVVGPRLFGGFAFRSDQRGRSIWSAFSGAYFILPRYQLTRVGRWTWVTANRLLEPGEDPDQVIRRLDEEIRKLEAFSSTNDQRPPTNAGFRHPSSVVGPSSWTWQTLQPLDPPAPRLNLDIENLIGPEVWQRLVTTATQRIRRGELDKVVLAQVCRARSSGLIDPTEVLGRLGESYPDCYRFLIEPIPGHAFYGATPELLAEVSGPIVRTAALAGSIGRGCSPEEDAALGETLLASPKDRHEHSLVVEAIQENLLPLVTKLYVPGTPGLCRLSNIQHLQTVIRGELAEACGVLPVVEALHPTPAVGGSPRDVALRLIDETEPFPRGWYASPVGWIDPRGNGLFAVALRSAVSVGCETWLYAGAGIVADSDPRKEWEEVRLKFRPILEALDPVSVISEQ